jgi:hypothetical protein
MSSLNVGERVFDPFESGRVGVVTDITVTYTIRWEDTGTDEYGLTDHDLEPWEEPRAELPEHPPAAPKDLS